MKIAVAGTGYVGLIYCHIIISKPRGNGSRYYSGER